MSFYSRLEKRKKLIAAHRGFRSIRPENTMSAFKAAVGQCDFIEFDINITKDLIPIVIHDHTLSRTSNKDKTSKFVDKTFAYEFTLKELKTLDFGTWFKKNDPFKTIKNNKVKKNKIKKESILTLEEILLFCKKKKILANIEIKDLFDTDFDDIIVKKIVEVIKKLEMQDSVLISSFNHCYLRQIDKLLPRVDKAVLVEDSHPNNLIKYLKDLNICAYNCCNEIITKDIVTYLKNESYKVNVYTVNDKKRKKELFSWGVDCIYTDFL